MREKIIIRTSIIGILANLLLTGFKIVIGMLSHSVAIVADALNNLSDALSSVVTIVGAKFSVKAPDKKHPLGHGRTEYISSAVISVLVLYTGFSVIIESVKKIISPETPEYSHITLVIVAVAVAVKLVLGTYVKEAGRKANSETLVNSGKDALLDALISSATLAAALVFMFSGVSLEAWLGAVIALYIIKSGIDMLRETLSHILGERVDSALARELKETITSFPDVYGAYDLVLHSYGPELLVGSVHIEVPENYTADQLDHLERKIAETVFEKHHVALTGISVYARNMGSGKTEEVLREIRRIVMSHDHVVQMHGFHYHEDEKEVQFDMVVDFEAPDREGLYRHILEEVQEAYPDHRFRITLDADISD